MPFLEGQYLGLEKSCKCSSWSRAGQAGKHRSSSLSSAFMDNVMPAFSSKSRLQPSPSTPYLPGALLPNCSSLYFYSISFLLRQRINLPGLLSEWQLIILNLPSRLFEHYPCPSVTLLLSCPGLRACVCSSIPAPRIAQ